MCRTHSQSHTYTNNYALLFQGSLPVPCAGTQEPRNEASTHLSMTLCPSSSSFFLPHNTLFLSPRLFSLHTPSTLSPHHPPTHWNGGRFVDDNQVLVLVHDSQRLISDWWLVAMHTVAHKGIVCDHCLHGSSHTVYCKRKEKSGEKGGEDRKRRKGRNYQSRIVIYLPIICSLMTICSPTSYFACLECSLLLRQPHTMMYSCYDKMQLKVS